MEHQDPELLALFFDEVDTHLNALNDGLLTVEEDIDKANQNQDLIGILFRAFHSIKGASGMLGFERINQLTHKGETLLDEVREGRIKFSPKTVEALLMSVDGLTQLIEELKGENELVVELDPIFRALDEALGITGSVIQKPADDTKTNEQTESDPELNNSILTNLEKYFPAFFDDTSDCINQMEEDLLKIEQTSEGKTEIKPSEEIINNLFRCAHQIKGSSATMGYENLSALTHSLENILDSLRSDEVPFTPDLLSLLLKCIDSIKAYMAVVQKDHSKDIEIKHLMEPLAKYKGKVGINSNRDYQTAVELDFESQKIIQEYQRDGQIVYHIKCEILPDALPGLRAFTSLSQVKNIGKIVFSTPSFDEIADANSIDTFEFVLATKTSQAEIIKTTEVDQINVIKCIELEEIKEEISEKTQSLDLDVADQQASKDTTTAVATQSTQTMRVDIDRLDYLMNMSGELVIGKARLNRIDYELKNVLNQKSLVQKINSLYENLLSIQNISELKNNKLKHVSEKLHRVAEECNLVANQVREIQKSQAIYNNFQEAVHQLDLVSNSMQRAVMEIRMVQVGPLFNRFKRVVRDVCKSLGKEVKLDLKGEETELDKKLIDELSDPLTHIIRNAVDHGVELPEDREKKGKDKKGHLILSAFHRGNRICISIQDDGKGIDAQYLRKKAVEKGIFTEQVAQNLSDKDAIQLIFHPGFSTAEKITNISGRGVGMDIVKKKIEELNGIIDIETNLGKGTLFTLSLPLTLAIQRSLMCKIYGENFALPLDFVVEIVQVSENDLSSVRMEKVICLRDKIIPVKSIKDFFKKTQFTEIVSNPNEEISDLLTLVIVGYQDNLIALKVDTLIGQEDIVIKSLTENFGYIVGLSGVSILGDGSIAKILDISTILENSFNESANHNVECNV